MKYLVFLFMLVCFQTSFGQNQSVKFLLDKSNPNGFIIFRNSSPTENRLAPYSLSNNLERNISIPHSVMFYQANEMCGPILARPGEKIIIQFKEGKQFFIVEGDKTRTNDQNTLWNFFKKFGPIYGAKHIFNINSIKSNSTSATYLKEFHRIENAYIQTKSFLDSAKTYNDLSTFFIFYLEKHLYYLRLIALLELANYNSLEARKILEEESATIIKDFCNEELIHNDIYRGFLLNLREKNSGNLIQYKQFNFVNELNCNAKEFILFNHAKLILNDYTTGNDTILNELSLSIKNDDYLNYINYHKEIQSNLVNLIQPDQLLNYTSDTLLLKNLLLSFPGKKIVIDFWASWCAPCIKELPKYEKLIKDFGKDSSVMFIFLSMDKNISAWSNSRKKFRFMNTNNSFLLNKNFESAIARICNINGIPRIILLDNNVLIKNNIENTDGIKTFLVQ